MDLEYRGRRLADGKKLKEKITIKWPQTPSRRKLPALPGHFSDLNGTVIYNSKQIKEMFRVRDEDEVLGTLLIDWIHPDDRGKALFNKMNASQGNSHHIRSSRVQNGAAG